MAAQLATHDPSVLAWQGVRRPDLLARSLLDALPGSALIVFDPDLRVRLIEGPGIERLGLNTDRVAGERLGDVLPPASWAQLEPAYRAVAAGEARRLVLHGSMGTRHAMSAVPVLDDSGEVAAGIAMFCDDTERERASRELERRLAQQSAVARLGELALRGCPDEELMHAAAETIADALGVDLASVSRHVGDGVMEVKAGVGWNDGFVGSRHEMATYREVATRAGYHLAPVVIEDLPSDTTLRARPLRAHDVVSGATIGIGDGATAFGVLGAYSRTRRSFTGHDLDFLRAVAHVIAAHVERRRTEARLRHNALHDGLTGLANRTLFLDRLALALRRQARTDEHVALFCLDLDDFKLVNDSLGHRAGDDLLRGVGARLRGTLRQGDTIARLGGDEFAILCEGVTDADAAALADRLVGALEAPLSVAGSPRFVRGSVGLVVAAAGTDRSPEDLLADADAAMYRAKERGRGRWELFDDDLRARLRARLVVEEDLRRALEHDPGQLVVAYQPIRRVADRSIDAVEALVRWQHPVRGLVPPGDFIPTAEESGLVVALGEHVLRTACRQVAAWRRLAPASGLRLSVNVSARQVASPGMVDAVARALADSGLAPEALGLEITEGLLLEDSSGTLATLRALQDLGVRLVLDDFGTGYSSLGYLMRYPVDALKIDRSFVAALGADGRGDGAIVQAIVGMARALDMPTIPEGVETEAQLARLAAMGCDFAQGFHLGRPLAAEDLTARLRDAAA